jgi:ubiquitin-protein ligase
VGLIPNPCDGRRLRYDERIERPDIRPGVDRTLNNIKSLLQEAGLVDEKYGLKEEVSNSSGLSTSRGIDVFKAPFDRFKSRIRAHQKNTSAWKVTQWAIHDAKKFEALINRLEKFVDGLESITRSLGLLEQQHARLELEINSISDTESLRLLRDASSSHHSKRHDVSDTASRRLVVVAESIAEQKILASRSIAPRTGTTFITANSRATTSIGSFTPLIPGAYPISGDTRSLAHTQCNSSRIASSEIRQITDHLPEVDRLENKGFAELDLPQNQRLVRSLVQSAKPRRLSFAAGDTNYGKRLATVKVTDDENWLSHSGNLVTHAHSGSSAAKRMFFDLRNIRTGKIPFVSAAPVQDSLDRVLASIEGPPETPYEGGIFWITVKLSDIDPLGPPLMRFQTKIYHPNISPKGHICADYKEKWNSVLSAGSTDGPVQNPTDLWYRRKSGETLWSLGALLTALCGLLATPDVDDPLVPEIAQKYLEDYDGYCQNAKLYTQLYATGERPEEISLIFLEDGPKQDFDRAKTMLPISKREPDVDVASIQRSLREIYDDPFPRSASEWSLDFEGRDRDRDSYVDVQDALPVAIPRPLTPPIAARTPPGPVQLEKLNMLDRGVRFYLSYLNLVRGSFPITEEQKGAAETELTALLHLMSTEKHCQGIAASWKLEDLSFCYYLARTCVSLLPTLSWFPSRLLELTLCTKLRLVCQMYFAMQLLDGRVKIRHPFNLNSEILYVHPESSNHSTWEMLPLSRNSFRELHDCLVVVNPTLKWDINFELPSEVVANELTAYFQRVWLTPQEKLLECKAFLKFTEPDLRPSRFMEHAMEF